MGTSLDAGADVAKADSVVMKLTRLDHRTVAINPDHVAWVEATPDTTVCMLGDRKIIVRESLEDVIAIFERAQRRLGRAGLVVHADPRAADPNSSGAD